MPSRSQIPDGPETERVRSRIQSLIQQNPDRVQRGINLSELTTFCIGGPAAGVCRVETLSEARKFQAFATEYDLPCYVLGGGSNVLAADTGYQGLILKMDIATWEHHGDTVRVGAGLNFDQLIARSLAEGLTGLEFASGIPGSVGGAVVGNAGCYGHEISEFLVQATILRPDGRLDTVGPGEFLFAYRHSALKDSGDIVLEIVLQLKRGDSAAAQQIRQEKLLIRRQKHPVRRPCAGSYFKNLEPVRPGERRRAAGELLDLVGAKNFRVGDAAVYEKHANIIVNEGQATSSEVLLLAERMKESVQQEYGVQLREEVRYLDPSGGVSARDR